MPKLPIPADPVQSVMRLRQAAQDTRTLTPDGDRVYAITLKCCYPDADAQSAPDLILDYARRSLIVSLFAGQAAMIKDAIPYVTNEVLALKMQRFVDAVEAEQFEGGACH